MAARTDASHEQADAYANLAVAFVDAAMNPHSHGYRNHGPDRLLRAAQVYATLSTRPPN